MTSYSAAAKDSIGYNQTWQNVTSSRNINTWYQNTTGKPIMLNIIENDLIIVDVYVNTIPSMSGALMICVGLSSSNRTDNMTPIIPPNYFYLAANYPFRWLELS